MTQNNDSTDQSPKAHGAIGPNDSGSIKEPTGYSVVNAVRDNVTVELWDVAELSEKIPNWSELSRQAKITELRNAMVSPAGRFTEHNVIVKPYREVLAELINPDLETANEEATHMAFGDDDTATDPDQEHLQNEVYRQQIDDHVTRQEEDTYAATILIQSDDAVGESLLEAGLVTTDDPADSDDMAFNRVLLDDPEDRLDPKTSDFAVTVTIEITYLDQSQAA